MTATEIEGPEIGSVTPDLFDSIGSALGDSPTDTGTPTEAAEDTPPGEAPTSPETPAEGSPETPPGEGPTSPYALTEDGAGYIVPKAELAPMTAYKEYATKAQEYFPTVNDAITAANDQGDWQALRSDFGTGNERKLDQILSFFMGNGARMPDGTPDLNTQFRFQNSFAKMVDRIPAMLKGFKDQNRPDFGQKVYEGLAAKFIDDKIEQKYQEALDQGDPTNPDDPLLKEAQQLEWLYKGVYRTNDQELQRQFRVQGISRPDPRQNEQQQFTQREQQIQQQAKALQDREFKSWDSTVLDGPKWNMFRAEIDKTLATVKDKFTPKMYAAAQRQISDDVVAAIKQDALFARNHNSDRATLEASFRQAWDRQQNPSGLSDQARTYINAFIAKARPQIALAAKDFLSNATASAVAAKKPAPPATPQRPRAAAPNGQPQQQKGPYELTEDPAWKQLFK